MKETIYVVQILNYKHNYYEEANNPEIYVYKSKKKASEKLFSCFKEKLNECKKIFNISIDNIIFNMQDEESFTIRNNNINFTGKIFTCSLS